MSASGPSGPLVFYKESIYEIQNCIVINFEPILQPEYQDKIRNAIKETVDINKNANPNTLWEIIKGCIRNETIKYASFKKKEQKKEIILWKKLIKLKPV